jgi:hypothetical protein
MPPTEVNVAAEASWLTNALSAVDTVAQLDRQATIKACPDLVSWLRADTCYQTSGPYQGWRDRVSGALLTQASGTMPAVTTESALNSQSALQYGSSGAVITDNGANLFPTGNTNFSIVCVAAPPSSGFAAFVSDGGTAGNGTILLPGSSNTPELYMGGANRLTGMSALSAGAPWLGIVGFVYGAGTGTLKARINGGAQTCAVTGLNVSVANSTLTIGGYNGGTPQNGMYVAEVMIFKNSILDGSYATTGYANWSGQTLYQVIESYMNARYGL